MARPTMSKTIYLQQLGRGMRVHDGKEFLMVFDFVDNAGMFNCPYSLHRLFNTGKYLPGGLVLGEKHAFQWEQELFSRGEKPEVLVDYPVHMTDYETVELFNWQDQAKDMITQPELTRRVSAQSETVERYVKEGKITPDLRVPVGEQRFFNYFRPERVPELCERFGWKQITAANMKEMFMDMAKQMTMSYSYKPVFIKALLDNMTEEGSARLEDIVQSLAGFYEDRVAKGLPAELRSCIFTKGGYTDKDVERLILSMPFKRFEDMNFIHHAKYLGVIRLDRQIVKRLTEADKRDLLFWCDSALERYFKGGK